MGLFNNLYKTFEKMESDTSINFEPIYHKSMQAHLCITIDDAGCLKNIDFLYKTDKGKGVGKSLGANVLIPVTESSSQRTGTSNCPHPLCDAVQYVAGDYISIGGRSVKKEGFDLYIKQLTEWHNFDQGNKALTAIFKYESNKTMALDIAKFLSANYYNVLDSNGKLIDIRAANKNQPKNKVIIPMPPAKKDAEDIGNYVVAWKVLYTNADGEIDELLSPVSLNKEIIQSWINFNTCKENSNASEDSDELSNAEDLCCVTGKLMPCTFKNKAGIRYPGDSNKIISINDKRDFTYRGDYFATPQESVTIGADTMQKILSALSYLAKNENCQSLRNYSDMTIIIWNPNSLKELPTFDVNSDFLLLEEGEVVDLGTDAAEKIKGRIWGYMHDKLNFSENDGICVLALDSVDKGRLAVTMYHEFNVKEFCSHIETFHSKFTWHGLSYFIQDDETQKSQKKYYDGAPSIKDILEVTVGRVVSKNGNQYVDINKKLSKHVFNFVFDSIIFGRQLPKYLIDAACNNASKRLGKKDYIWKQQLAVTCSLYRGYTGGQYKLMLEKDRTERSYLFGRLMALAEDTEATCLRMQQIDRPTTAEKHFKGFTYAPAFHWGVIEPALQVYFNKLKKISYGMYVNRKREINDVMAMFQSGDFEDNKPLTPAFYLGYHNQMKYIYDTRAAAKMAKEAANIMTKDNGETDSIQKTENAQ